MRLRYYRKEIRGKTRFVCESDVVNGMGVHPLVCLLMDDGGLGREAAVDWLERGIQRIESVRRGSGAEANWDREDWGAEIRMKGVTIYSLHQEDCREEVLFPPFIAL